MLRWYLSRTLHFYSDWQWPYCAKEISLHDDRKKLQQFYQIQCINFNLSISIYQFHFINLISKIHPMHLQICIANFHTLLMLMMIPHLPLTPHRNKLLCQLFRALRQQQISAKIKVWHPWQLKKSKSWGLFWSYQQNSTAHPAHLPQN